jgi:hypothetical protein
MLPPPSKKWRKRVVGREAPYNPFSHNPPLAEAAFAKHPCGASRHVSKRRQAAIDRFGDTSRQTLLFRRQEAPKLHFVAGPGVVLKIRTMRSPLIEYPE